MRHTFIMLLIIGLMTLIGCRDTDRNNRPDGWVNDSNNQSVEPQPDNQTPDGPLPEFDSYDEALSAAKRLNAKMLVIFHADWCGPCQSMKRTTWSNSQVKQAMSRYVVAKVNADKEPRVIQKYRIGGIPAYAIIDHNEQVIKKGTGNRPPAAIVDWLK